MIGLAATAAHLLAGLPMGYNRDTREIKEWSALGFDKTLSALSTLRITLATLTVDHERMLEAVRNNYSSTTDLADAVAQQTGVGYRQIYAIIGRVVDRAIEAGKPLYTVSAQEIVQEAEEAGVHIAITEEQVQQALDPARAVALRKHTGGANPTEMSRLLTIRMSTLADHKQWVAERHAQIDAARQETQARAASLTSAELAR